MTVENLKSPSITNADASPIAANTRGTGAPAYQYTVQDTIAVTASGVGSVGSTYQVVRIPSNAKAIGVVLATSAALDSNSSNTLAFDVNLAFSDSTTDGTPASLQGLIPTTANTGATTTVASYSSPNKIYGTVTPSSHTAALGLTDYVVNGIGSAYPLSKIMNTELWSLFGFSEAQGNFDLLLYVSTGAATGVAGTIYGRINYIV